MHSIKLLYALLLPLLLFLIVAQGRSVSNNLELQDESSWKYYVQDNGNMSLVAKPDNGKFKDCYLFGDQSMTALALQDATATDIFYVDGKKMSSLIDLCTYNNYNPLFMSADQEMTNIGLGSWGIFPETKWCGAGDIAKDKDDLGPARETDLCCREHDHCQDNIDGFGSKYGLMNMSPFTKSHCDCDNKFHECLNKVNTKISNQVGDIYFNKIRVECFKKDYPITGCRKSKGWYRPRCVAYSLDKTRSPIWQWFDAKEYVKESQDVQELDHSKYALFDYALKSSAM